MEIKWKKTKAILALASLATSPFLSQHFGAIDMPTNRIIGEAVGHRKLNSKTFIRDDGTATSRFSQTPVHYKDANGYQNIENTLTFDGLSRFKNKNFFEVSVPNVFTNGQVGKLGGKQITFIPLLGNPVSPIFHETETDHGDFNMMTQKYDKNLARYVEAWDGVDVEYRTKYYGIKESIIVKNATAPTTFRFRLDNTFPNPPTFQENAKRMMKFQDGNDIIELDNITAIDAKGRNVPIVKTWNLPQTILTLSYNPILEVTSTTTHSVAYPVTIDPTTRFNIQGGTEVTSFDGWIDLCFTAGQSEANHRLDSANCTTTNNNDTASLVTSVGFTGHAPPRPTGGRAWMHWNTATTITSGATINAGASTSIGIVISGIPTNSYNDGIDYIAITQATTSGPLPLQVSVADGDWKRVTGLFSDLQLLATSSVLTMGTEDNGSHDITSMANGEARTFILNATGRANIAIGGGTYATTTFGTCEGHDCEETAHGGGGDTNNIITFSSAEGADPPILDVDWTAAAVVDGRTTRKIILISWLEKFIYKAYAFYE